MMTTFTFNGTEVDFNTLPPSSQSALLSRVAGHFNNESASAAINWAKTQVAGTEGKAADVSTESARAYREAHPDETSAFVKSWFGAKLGQILDGTLGTRVAGTSVDPLEAAMHRIASDEVKSLFPDAYPRGKEGAKGYREFLGSDGTIYKGRDGLDTLARRWLTLPDKQGRFGKAGEQNEARIERLAKRELAAKVEAAKKAIGQGDVAEAGF